jgi:multisubunit Na+/H+ antiporter MnhF subunit
MITFFTSVLYAALVVHIGLIFLSLYYFWRRKEVFDRLITADLITNYGLAMLVILALIVNDTLFLDVSLGLAAVGFIGVIALAKYIADQQMF